MKLLSGNIAKRKYLLIIISSLLLLAVIAVVYILGGFRLITGNKDLDFKDTSSESTSNEFKLFDEFDNKFKNISLPYSIELNNVSFDTTSYNHIANEEAKVYLNDFKRDNNYFAVGKFNINDAHNAYIILKLPQNATFEYLYLLKIFSKNYELRGQMNLAEFSGDRNNLIISESQISEDLSIVTTNKKATIIAGDSIKFNEILQSKKYNIKADGTISTSTPAL